VITALKASDYEDVFKYVKVTDQGDVWVPSTMYLWNPDMIEAVFLMSTKGIAGLKLWLDDWWVYGMVNIAAFLAQCMQETIRYNACDENNWSDSLTNPGTAEGGVVYPASSSCGQLGQSYQDYHCSAEEDAIAGGRMACEVDVDMEARAFTKADYWGVPPELFCAPKSKVPKAPRWNGVATCPWCPDEGWRDPDCDTPPIDTNESLDAYWYYVNSGGSCLDYPNQKSGGWTYSGGGCTAMGCPNMPSVHSRLINPEVPSLPGACCNSSQLPPTAVPVRVQSLIKVEAEAETKADDAADMGRTDVEGCCWWGRGVIQTTGVCNFGKLNFYAGKRAKDEGREANYPHIDFCKNPGAICDPSSPPELKWVAGFFYWLNSVQPYDVRGWNYINELTAWVDNGMDLNDHSFIDAVSGIVNRGCHDPPCGTGALHAREERRKNFAEVMRAMHLVA